MFPSVTTILAPYSGIAEIKKRYPDIIARASDCEKCQEFKGCPAHNPNTDDSDVGL